MGKLMQEIFKKAKALELSKEIEKAYLYTDLNAAAAQREVLEQYKNARNPTDQSMRNEHNKDFNDIIALDNAISK